MKATGIREEVRVATSSVRCCRLLRLILDEGGPVVRGQMTWSVHETAFLFARGFDDFVVASPLRLQAIHPDAAGGNGEHPAAMTVKDAARAEDDPQSPGRILVVDDDRDLTKASFQMLKGAGFEAHRAHSGSECLDLAARLEPDVVLLDVVMPDMSGFDVCRRLRERLPRAFLPVILVTGRNDPESLLEGYAAGASDYIVKPFRKDELLSRVRVMLELKRSRDALDRLVEVKDEILAMATSDLVTPIGNILDACDFLLAGSADLHPDACIRIDRIRASALHARRLVEGVVRLAAMEKGGLRANLRNSSIGRVVGESLAAFAPVARRKGIRLVQEEETPVPAFFFDPELIREVVDNLVSNAIKFSNQGTVKVTCGLRVDKVAVEVADSGPGISPEDSRRLFKPFGRGSTTGGGKEDGPGLGLSIARSLVELHGGAIEAVPGPAGATFRFTLPWREGP